MQAAQQILESRAHANVETVRVGVDLLDMLMNLVGELVLARNQLLQASNSLQDVPLQSVSQRVNLIVTAVQQQVMKTRMQPIGNVWNKFPRTVRDLALSCGKEVQLEMQGQDTELDRTIIEAIKDPLTHLVRKAIDHGIEAPDARRSAGKDPAGRLVLRAFHEGGRVKIEIQDDGPGLNADRLLKKAIERGLVQEHQAKTMAERDVFNLIFLPGFSTAEKVTKVDQANTVSQAAQQVSQNLQGVSAGGEEMTATIQSIASNSHDAATIASKAVPTAQAANTTIGKLGESSAEIGEVIKVITSIAQQTKLLVSPQRHHRGCARRRKLEKASPLSPTK